jgi:hypothetical protein
VPAILQLHILSVILPILSGLFNYKKLDIGLRYVFYYLIFILVREQFLPYLHSALYINIESIIYKLFFIFFYTVAFIEWAGIKKIKKLIFIELLVIFSLSLLDIFYIGLDTFRVSIFSVVINVSFTLVIVYLINKTLNSREADKGKKVKLLILIPNLVFYFFFNALDILMIFLYSSKTQEIFISLHVITQMLLLGVYFCFSLAFYLKPKKEVYLQ